MTGHASGVFCLDASVLIDVQSHYPESLRQLNRHAKDGRIVIPEGVAREICKKSDRLKYMVQSWQKHGNAVVQIRLPPLQSEMVRLENAYGQDIYVGKLRIDGFWASRRGRQAADSQVLAVSKVNSCVCVSNDRAIQAVCHLENIPNIGWQEFYRQMRQGLTGQTLLFE